MNKKLCKSGANKMICGVCGGIADYFGVDPTLIRLGWALFCAAGGSGFVAYVIAAVLMPAPPEET